MDSIDQLNKLLDAYNGILKSCYDALEAGAPQESRDALRKSISQFLENKSD
jgi:hypothetical protein